MYNLLIFSPPCSKKVTIVPKCTCLFHSFGREPSPGHGDRSFTYLTPLYMGSLMLREQTGHCFKGLPRSHTVTLYESVCSGLAVQGNRQVLVLIKRRRKIKQYSTFLAKCHMDFSLQLLAFLIHYEKRCIKVNVEKEK